MYKALRDTADEIREKGEFGCKMRCNRQAKKESQLNGKPSSKSRILSKNSSEGTGPSEITFEKL